jgi:phage-related baseplate assembly protein
MSDIIKKTTKDIKYLDRDFDSLKKGLIEFTKNYYPNTYNDFNESSPGSLFLDLAAYVGDSLSYYVDSQFKENLLIHATEKRNVMAIAAALGYKPKMSIPSQVTLDVFQLVPATGTGASVKPDYNYALKLEAGMEVFSSVNNVTFITQTVVDFSVDDFTSPREVSVYSLDGATPVYYLLKKQVKAISARQKTVDFPITEVERFKKLLLQDDLEPIVGIQSIVDSDGNTWYEVPYLAQDTIFEQLTNTAYNDPDAAVYSAEVPNLLKLKRVPRRFITRVTESGLEIQFGSGESINADEEILATPENIGLSLPTGKEDTDASIDPSNPLITTAYGIAPSNTTLTVTYLVGGGVTSNVPSNTITTINSVTTNQNNLPPTTINLNNAVVQSLAINNATAAQGGRSAETIEEIRQNALAQFTSQQRAVTREDYIVRAYAMPNTYGSVAKVFITPDEQNNIGTAEVRDTVANPLALNMYTLGYNNNKNLTTVNRAVKENLKVYLSQYRMLTDSINIRDAYIINIGVDFDIIPIPNVNANEVLVRAIQSLKNYFNVDKWQINQPIVYSDMFTALLQTKGVQTVTSIKIKNLNDSDLGYSDVMYDIASATRNGIVYPSLDPAIFEVKFLDNDIRGKIASF